MTETSGPPPPWAVGDFAALTGVPATTLRYWDSAGLLPPDRSGNGHRRYGPHHMARVAMIRMCQDLGATVDETRLIIDPPDPGARIAYARERLPDVLERIETLTAAAAILRHIPVCAHLDLAACGAWMGEQLGHGRAAD